MLGKRISIRNKNNDRVGNFVNCSPVEVVFIEQLFTSDRSLYKLSINSVEEVDAALLGADQKGIIRDSFSVLKAVNK